MAEVALGRAMSSVQLYNFCKCVFSFGVPVSILSLVRPSYVRLLTRYLPPLLPLPLPPYLRLARPQFYLVSWTDLPAWEEGGSGSFTASYVAQGVIVTVLGLAMIALLIPFGRRIRAKQGLPVL